jgi:hypothetical protein
MKHPNDNCNRISFYTIKYDETPLEVELRINFTKQLYKFEMLG